MSDFEQIEQIKQLKARYLRYLDTRQWQLWKQVFTEDVITDYGDGKEKKPVGVGKVIEMTRSVLEGTVSVHHAHPPEITIIDDSNAQGIWGMEDIIDAPDYLLHGYGHYHEDYRKVEGEWRISRVELRRLKRDVSPK